MNKLPQLQYYKIIRSVGGGGFSTVYEAIDLRSEKKVAIKSLSLENEYARNRFKIESIRYRDLCRCNGIPYLVEYIEDETKTHKCIVMEYVEGVNLKDYLKDNGPLDDERVKNIFGQILDTLSYFHKKGVVHLDIKPENIMLTPEDKVKIIDLGISATKEELADMKVRVGSYEFMAPEQINREPLGVYTDIYQVGVTIFKSVTGKMPFAGASKEELFDKICKLPVPEIANIFPGSNESLQCVIDKAMSKDPSQRYVSCEEFKEDLLNVLKSKKKRKKTNTNTDKEKYMGKDVLITVGREIDCDVTISDPQVSRKHLQLRRDKSGAVFVRDLGSTNGTFVNGQRLSGERQLDTYDSIRIGNTNLPWPQYFESPRGTELDDEQPEKGEKKLNGGKWKSVGKWLWRNVSWMATSIIMMIIMFIIMSSFREKIFKTDGAKTEKMQMIEEIK